MSESFNATDNTVAANTNSSASPKPSSPLASAASAPPISVSTSSLLDSVDRDETSVQSPTNNLSLSHLSSYPPLGRLSVGSVSNVLPVPKRLSFLAVSSPGSASMMKGNRSNSISFSVGPNGSADLLGGDNPAMLTPALSFNLNEAERDDVLIRSKSIFHSSVQYSTSTGLTSNSASEMSLSDFVSPSMNNSSMRNSLPNQSQVNSQSSSTSVSSNSSAPRSPQSRSVVSGSAINASMPGKEYLAKINNKRLSVPIHNSAFSPNSGNSSPSSSSNSSDLNGGQSPAVILELPQAAISSSFSTPHVKYPRSLSKHKRGTSLTLQLNEQMNNAPRAISEFDRDSSGSGIMESCENSPHPISRDSNSGNPLKGMARLRSLVRARIFPTLPRHRLTPDEIVLSFINHKFGDFDVNAMLNRQFTINEFRSRVAAKLHHLNARSGSISGDSIVRSNRNIASTINTMCDMYRSLRAFHTLLSIPSAFKVDSNTRGQALKSVLTTLYSLIDAERVSLWSIDKNSGEVRIAISHGEDKDDSGARFDEGFDAVKSPLSDSFSASRRHAALQSPLPHSFSLAQTSSPAVNSFSPHSMPFAAQIIARQRANEQQIALIRQCIRSGDIVNWRNGNQSILCVPVTTSTNLSSAESINSPGPNATSNNGSFSTNAAITSVPRISAVIELSNKRSSDSATSKGFTDEDIQQLKFISLVIGQTLENAGLYEESVLRRRQQEALCRMIELMSAETGVDHVVTCIVDAAYQLIDVDRISLYVVDEIRGYVICKVSKDQSAIGQRLPLKYGIVGLAVEKGEIINITDAANDKRYDSTLDTINQYKTFNVLTLPIKDNRNKVVAVIQVINKKARNENSFSPFTDEDVVLMSSLSRSAGQILRKAQLFEALIMEQKKTKALISVLQAEEAEQNIERLIDKILRTGQECLPCSNISLFFMDPVREDYYIMALNGNSQSIMQFASPPKIGIAGLAAESGKLINVTNLKESGKVNNSMFDSRVGIDSHHCLCLPIFNSNGNPIAVLQAVNKLNSRMELNPFTEDDEELLKALSIQVGSTLRRRLTEILLGRSRRELADDSQIHSLLEIYGESMSSVGQFKANHDKDKDKSKNNNNNNNNNENNNKHRESVSKPTNNTTHPNSAAVSELSLVTASTTILPVTSVWPIIEISSLPPISQLHSFDFNPFDYNEDELVVYSYGMLDEIGVVSNLGVSPSHLQSFILAIRANYRANPYHNFFHGFSVLQFAYMILKKTKAVQFLNSLDVFTLLIASLAHDVAHPGSTNTFQLNTESVYARAFNEQSILENLHSFITLELIRKPEFDILRNSNCTKDQIKTFRKSLIQAILATDMAVHFDLCKKLDSLEPDCNSLSANKEEDRQFILNIIVHCADLSGQVTPTKIASQWEARVSEEFIGQYNQEVALGIPVSSFMQGLSDHSVRFRNHLNFIDFVMSPLWTGMAELFKELRPCVNNLLANRKYFMDLIPKAEETNKLAAAAAKPAAESAKKEEKKLAPNAGESSRKLSIKEKREANWATMQSTFKSTAGAIEEKDEPEC